LLDADIGHDALDPLFEAVRIAQRWHVAPGEDERILQGVTRSVAVAQDTVGNSEQPVPVAADELHERPLISLPRRFDDVARHATPSARRS
jgi:hypothetical protein